MTVITRRAVLQAVGVLVAGAGAPVRADDVVEFDSGSTERCARYVEYETRAGEEFESCIGPDGGFVEEIDEAGNEERTEFDPAGRVRRRFEEDDGDEQEWIYDENGTLRVYREEQADGDEQERIYDGNGVLRYRRREDDDGDEREWWYDENGTLRVFTEDDENGDDDRRVYDADGVLVDSRDD